ncbi:diguanylate cyclase [Sulfurimonas sp.]|uniref:GGDEF domain-containing protein n=1 Tax=Sulfurimonas sp. TaxID=2022749 RepID=UPI003562B892
MRRYIPTILVVFASVIIVSVFLFSEYILSSFEKITFAIIFSIILGILFQLRQNALEEKNTFLKVQQISEIGFWKYDLKKGTLFWSDEIYNMFKIDKGMFKLSFESFVNIVYEDDRECVKNAYLDSLKTKKDYEIKHRVLLSNGELKWVIEKCKTDFDSNGQPLVSVGIVIDVTKEENYIHQVEKSESTLSSIINSTDDLIFFKDKEFKYLGCNDAFLKFVGQTKDKMIGHNDFELFREEMASQFREMDVQMLEKNEVSSNYEWITYPDGERKYLLVQKIPFKYNNKDTGVLGIARDITELHLAQKKIKDQTYVDELTKLYNRKSYNKRVEELLSLKKRYKTKFSMIMFDIDDFKQVNDTYGHKVGDEVLVKLSNIVKSQLRENDYVFRIGGEEFVVLLTETGLESAVSVAEKLRKNISEKLDEVTDRTITVSLGVSESNESDTEDTIFRRVDRLLYKSKNSGKNRVSVG